MADKQKLVSWLVAAGFVVVILAGVLQALLQTRKFELGNLDQVESGLSSTEVAELEEFVEESLERIHGKFNEGQEVVALVRPSSWVRTKKNGVVNYEFLVDVDEFLATYRVSFAMMKGSGFYEAPNVECPEPSLMKYADVECRGEKTSTFSVTVGRSLPYYFNLADGRLVTVTRGVGGASDGFGEFLQVRVSACGDETVKAAARREVEEWIAGLGYAAEKYKIEIPEFCDGEAR